MFQKKPKLATYVHLLANNQTAGRDKLARLVQYLSRVVWYRLQRNNRDGVNAVKNLEFQLSTFRKLLRFGRCIDTLYSTLPIFRHDDTTLRVTVILGKIANSLFLLTDHLLWLGRADVCVVDTEKYSRISNKYWLYSITMNLVRDFYEIYNLLKKDKRNPGLTGVFTNTTDFSRLLTILVMILQENKGIMLDTIKNGCDFFIPLTVLGHTSLSPGTIGILGTISSIAGLIVKAITRMIISKDYKNKTMPNDRFLLMSNTA